MGLAVFGQLLIVRRLHQQEVIAHLNKLKQLSGGKVISPVITFGHPLFFLLHHRLIGAGQLGHQTDRILQQQDGGLPLVSRQYFAGQYASTLRFWHLGQPTPLLGFGMSALLRVYLCKMLLKLLRRQQMSRPILTIEATQLTALHHLLTQL
ncbi:hypothetical protein D3C84_598290 [compost metagenome]